MCGEAWPRRLRLIQTCGCAAGAQPHGPNRMGHGKAEPFRTSGGKAANVQASMIEIVNRQRGRTINAKQWREFTEKALGAIGGNNRGATIVFVSDDTIKKLNRRFRGKSVATDVLSFPTEAEPFEVENGSHLGDVVISVERAATQAKENGLSFSGEVEQLILHGLLHLCGYDHETDKGEMNRLELKLRRKLGI
jgi:probable rRNA maturation factor